VHTSWARPVNFDLSNIAMIVVTMVKPWSVDINFYRYPSWGYLSLHRPAEIIYGVRPNYLRLCAPEDVATPLSRVLGLYSNMKCNSSPLLREQLAAVAAWLCSARPREPPPAAGMTLGWRVSWCSFCCLLQR